MAVYAKMGGAAFKPVPGPHLIAPAKGLAERRRPPRSPNVGTWDATKELAEVVANMAQAPAHRSANCSMFYARFPFAYCRNYSAPDQTTAGQKLDPRRLIDEMDSCCGLFLQGRPVFPRSGTNHRRNASWPALCRAVAESQLWHRSAREGAGRFLRNESSPLRQTLPGLAGEGGYFQFSSTP